MRTLLALAGLLAVVASFLPVAETNLWWVRVLDFPRIHYLVVLLLAGTAYALLGGRRHRSGWALLGLMVLAAGYNIYKLYPFERLMPAMAVAAQNCPEDSRLRILSVNVRMGNREAEPLLDLVRRSEPDLFFAMETDAWWDRQFAPLESALPHQVDHIDPNYFGLHLMSKLPLLSPEVRFLSGKDSPSVYTGVLLPNGRRIEFFGIHPKPPTLGQASTWRDAEILAAASLARTAPAPVVLAGDLNAVPWERVVRRALRVGGLLDPRVGRGYLASYDARQPWFWWPLDQVLFQDSFTLLGFERLADIGSDHYPILAELCHQPQAAQRQEAPALQDGDLEEAQRTMEAGLVPEAQPLARIGQ